jgi:hypothetical protein
MMEFFGGAPALFDPEYHRRGAGLTWHSVMVPKAQET